MFVRKTLDKPSNNLNSMDGRKIEDWEQLRSDCFYERTQYPPTNSDTVLIILLLTYFHNNILSSIIQN
jgi:hypothetical protein